MSKVSHFNFMGAVHLAADHAGFELKERMRERLAALGCRIEDHGAHTLDALDDYPEIIRPAAEAIQADVNARAILFGKSGEGEAMVANRIHGVRAAVYTGGDIKLVQLAREHNDANALSIGADFVSIDGALEAIQMFLQTQFSGEERHVRRIHELDE